MKGDSTAVDAFAPSAFFADHEASFNAGFDGPDALAATHLQASGEFERLWRAFMAARFVLGLLLLFLQGTLELLSQTLNPRLLLVCGAYCVAALAVLWFAQPRRYGRTFNPQWASTIGVDLLAYTLLQFLQAGVINYAPLFVLPVLMAAILGSLWLALGTAASVSLLLLAHSAWLALQLPQNQATQFAQSALTGTGCFVIAFLANQLSVRLASEEQRSRLNQLAARVQRQVNELVIESLSEGILVVDKTGRVRAANPAARLLLGVTTSRPDFAFSLDSEVGWAELSTLARQSFLQGGAERANLTIHHPSQGLRRLQAHTRLTQARATGEESLCVMFLQDQRELEARIRSDKLASMGRMSAAVAHEIRNPLAAITQANALLDEDTTDPRHKRLTQMVAQNASRLGRIVDEVLNLSRIQHPENAVTLQHMALSESVARIFRDWTVQTGSAHLARIELLNIDVEVAFESEHLRRVMINLLDNARRFASGHPAGIQVRVDRDSAEQGQVAVWSDGLPLEPSVERHLFEPFFSSESRSSGLGMYICRELCEGHGAGIVYRRTRRTLAGVDTEGNEFCVTFRTK